MTTNEKIIEIAKLMHKGNECASIYDDDMIKFEEEVSRCDRQDHLLIRAAYKVMAGESEFVSTDNPETITRAGLLANDLGGTYEPGTIDQCFIGFIESVESGGSEEETTTKGFISIVLKPSRQAAALKADNNRKIQATPAIKEVEALIRSHGAEPRIIRSDKPLTEKRIMICRGADAHNAGIPKDELPAGLIQNPDFMLGFEKTGSEPLKAKVN
jgi:hypothetical protein